MVSKVFKRKTELYNLLDASGGYYLPPLRDINSIFLRSFLKGSKTLFLKKEVLCLGYIPKFEELSTEKILDTVITDRNLSLYLLCKF